MKLFFKLIFLLVAIIAPYVANGATQKLKEIYDEKGMEYLLKNHEAISKKIDINDKFYLADFLIYNYKGPEALTLLLELAKKDHIKSIALIIEKYNTGINGISIDEKKSQFWVKKLEGLYKKSSEDDRHFIEYHLCKIYSDKYGVLKNDIKTQDYCSKVFERPENIGFFASMKLQTTSVFFDPKKGIELFEKCIQEGGWACKLNYAYMGLSSPDIAKNSSAKQLFEYASDDKSVANALNNLGLFYERGIGTKVDIKKAIEQFDKAIRYGSGHGVYNLIFYSFFYPSEFESTAKTFADAQKYLMIYDYWTEQNGRFDALPYKEWLSEKYRMPTNQSEFIDYLKDRTKNGDARSSCLLADYYLNLNQLDMALDFANYGKKSKDKRVSEWCDGIDSSVQVMKIFQAK